MVEDPRIKSVFQVFGQKYTSSLFQTWQMIKGSQHKISLVLTLRQMQTASLHLGHNDFIYVKIDLQALFNHSNITLFLITACPPDQVGSPVNGACAGKSNGYCKDNHKFQLLIKRVEILSTLLILYSSKKVINKSFDSQLYIWFK